MKKIKVSPTPIHEKAADQELYFTMPIIRHLTEIRDAIFDLEKAINDLESRKIDDAPEDGFPYVRKNKSWNKIT